MKTALVTGTSSGLGRGPAEVLSRQGWAVYGCSRRGCDLPLVRDRICDLTHEAAVPKVLGQLLADVDKLDSGTGQILQFVLYVLAPRLSRPL